MQAVWENILWWRRQHHVSRMRQGQPCGKCCTGKDLYRLRTDLSWRAARQEMSGLPCVCHEGEKKLYSNGPARPLGSIDVCQMCGKEYTVVSGRQKYCPGCRRDANLAWQRVHSAGYHKRPEVSQARQARRKERRKVCVYCQLPFWDSSTSNLCSDYCREKHWQILRYQAEIRRGKNANIKALEKSRQEYRDKVKKDISDKSGEE